MNTTLHRTTTTTDISTTHPPDTRDRTVLHIPAADELRELRLADRLSLRIGVWLLERAQRPKRTRSERLPVTAQPVALNDNLLSAGESTALLIHHLQRQIR